jgi:hypothetical protein
MSAAPIDLLGAARAHLGAATSAPEPACSLHLARARTLYEQAADELRSIEHALVARERAWAERSTPATPTASTQTTLPATSAPATARPPTRHYDLRAGDPLPAELRQKEPSK